ncbi:hypothetical protein NCC49_003357 [Naganishia albida]|nr:hypothetical protein NCC49_003357 [Naganishia albida]
MSTLKYSNKLRGKKVLVVGGSAGIGYAAAEAALENQAHIYIASSSIDRVNGAVSKLKDTIDGQSAGSVQGRTIDLTSDSSVKEVVDWVSNDTEGGKQSGIDHVIFTAGDSLMLGDLSQVNIDDCKCALEVRFWGMLRVVKFAHPAMMDRGRYGSITVTSGTVAYKPAKGWSVAAGMGGSVESVTRGLAVDLAPTRVNCVLPGAVDTPMWDPMGPEGKAATFKHFEGKVLTGKVGVPEEIAEGYLYLMKGSYTTGTCIVLDGGAMLT